MVMNLNFTYRCKQFPTSNGNKIYLQKNHHRAIEVGPCPVPAITFGISEVFAIMLPEAFLMLFPSTLQTIEPDELRILCPSTFPTDEPEELLIIEPSTFPIIVPDEERNVVPSNLKLAIEFLPNLFINLLVYNLQ